MSALSIQKVENEKATAKTGTSEYCEDDATENIAAQLFKRTDKCQFTQGCPAQCTVQLSNEGATRSLPNQFVLSGKALQSISRGITWGTTLCPCEDMLVGSKTKDNRSRH